MFAPIVLPPFTGDKYPQKTSQGEDTMYYKFFKNGIVE